MEASVKGRTLVVTELLKVNSLDVDAIDDVSFEQCVWCGLSSPLL